MFAQYVNVISIIYLSPAGTSCLALNKITHSSLIWSRRKAVLNTIGLKQTKLELYAIILTNTGIHSIQMALNGSGGDISAGPFDF